MPRRVFLTAALAFLLSLVACADRQDPSASQRTELSGEWRTIADPPSQLPPFGRGFWTGDQFVVWGSSGHSVDRVPRGATYDPGADRWSMLPLAPTEVLDTPAATWTGTEVVFIGVPAGPPFGERPVAVAFDPAAGSWRALPEPPIPPAVGYEAVWTGSEILIWGGRQGDIVAAESSVHSPPAAIYNRETDTWRRIADVPAPWSGEASQPHTVSHEGKVYVYREHLAGGSDPVGSVGRYDLELDAWTAVGPSTPERTGAADCQIAGGGPGVVGAKLGAELFLWNDYCAPRQGRAIDLESGQWRKVAAHGFEPGGVGKLIAGDGALYGMAHRSGSPVLHGYDIENDRWATGEPDVHIESDPDLIWTGKELLLLNGWASDTPERPGAAFTPAKGRSE